jgi:hypothetical protein
MQAPVLDIRKDFSLFFQNSATLTCLFLHNISKIFAFLFNEYKIGGAPHPKRERNAFLAFL